MWLGFGHRLEAVEGAPLIRYSDELGDVLEFMLEIELSLNIWTPPRHNPHTASGI